MFLSEFSVERSPVFLPGAPGSSSSRSGLLVNILFGKWFSEKVIGIVASLAVGGLYRLAPAGCFAQFLPGNLYRSAFQLDLYWGVSESGVLQVDTLAVVMMLVVSGVGVPDPYLRHRLHA